MNVDQQCKLFGPAPPDLLPNLTVAAGSLHWWIFLCARKSVLGDLYQHSRHVEQSLDFCTFHLLCNKTVENSLLIGIGLKMGIQLQVEGPGTWQFSWPLRRSGPQPLPVGERRPHFVG